MYTEDLGHKKKFRIHQKYNNMQFMIYGAQHSSICYKTKGRIQMKHVQLHYVARFNMAYVHEHAYFEDSQHASTLHNLIVLLRWLRQNQPTQCSIIMSSNIVNSFVIFFSYYLYAQQFSEWKVPQV
jgi:hypothetical protein